jgi:putative proteasome-type protease
MLLDTGLVFLSDSRTSAGVDQISTFRKTVVFQRVIRRSSSLNEAAKAALVSMDSTIRSNLSVGLPLDLVILRRNRFEIARHINIDSENEYFHGLRDRWSDALREAFVALPEPDWRRYPLT